MNVSLAENNNKVYLLISVLWKEVVCLQLQEQDTFVWMPVVSLIRPIELNI